MGRARCVSVVEENPTPGVLGASVWFGCVIDGVHRAGSAAVGLSTLDRSTRAATARMIHHAIPCGVARVLVGTLCGICCMRHRQAKQHQRVLEAHKVRTSLNSFGRV